MGMVEISQSDDTLLFRLDDCDSYKDGILNHFHDYIKNVSSESITEKNGKLYVEDGLITGDYINEYLKKNPVSDLSAKDCAYLSLKHVGMPPIDEMSIKSLEKFIKSIIEEEYKDKAYCKHAKGNKNVTCVDYKTACEIAFSEDVSMFVGKQIKKAEKKEKHNDEVAWREYEFQKKKLKYLEMLRDSYEEPDDFEAHFRLSNENRTNLMVDAIFRRVFTDFDFEKYESYMDEMNQLYDNWEFGERYQFLYDVFHSPNFNGEFYKLSLDESILDALADKIVEKLNKKIHGEKD